MWFRKKTRREELTEARDDVRRQLEILEAGPAMAGTGASRSDSDKLIEELRILLAELEDNLADLAPDETRRPFGE